MLGHEGKVFFFLTGNVSFCDIADRQQVRTMTTCAFLDGLPFFMLLRCSEAFKFCSDPTSQARLVNFFDVDVVVHDGLSTCILD